MTDHWTQRLSEYLDGELGRPEREELEQHLFACGECTRTLTELRKVVDRARALDDRPPTEDLWPAIAARIGLESRGGTYPAPDRWSTAGERAPGDAENAHGKVRPLPRRFSFSLPQLAAAAVMLMMISGGAVELLRRGAPGTAGSDTPVPLARSVRPAADTTTGVRLVAGGSLGGSGYDAAVADLERALEQGRRRLRPETLEVLERNLETIDAAITDARRALAADPGDRYLTGHLASAMRRKLELLRRANELADVQT